MANVTLQAEYYYIDGVQQSSPSYGWAGYNTSNKKYYVSVAKYYTDSYICAPKFALFTGGTDNTNSSKQLGVYFVACSSNSTPSNTIITTPSQIANNHQTRIRFGYTYYSNGTYSSYNNTSWGYGETSSSLVLAPGYFFVYIGTAQASSHTYSSHYTINSKYYPAQLTYSTPSTYTVSYDANGGTGAPSSQTKVQYVNLTLSSTKPSKGKVTKDVTGSFIITGEGNGGYFGSTSITSTSITASTSRTDTTTYNFTGWNTEKNGSGDSYAAGATYSNNSGVKLYAQYSSSTETGSTSYSNNTTSSLSQPKKDPTTTATYTVTYNLMGGTASSSSETVKTTRTWKFEGWATSENSTSANAAASYTSTTTVYAYWTYTDTNGKATLPTPTRVGYKFLGWGTSETQTSGLLPAGGTPEIGADTIYYAIWKADGSIRIYINSTDKYKIAMVWVYAPLNSSDQKPWKLAIPYLKTSSDWKIIAG